MLNLSKHLARIIGLTTKSQHARCFDKLSMTSVHNISVIKN
jgi:hypothetical protein